MNRAIDWAVLKLDNLLKRVGERAHEVRMRTLRCAMRECGHGVKIYGPTRITGLENLRLGNNVHINRNSTIRAEGGVTIGDNTHISSNMCLYSVNHRFRDATCIPYDEHHELRPVTIGRNVWIGMNVSIAPGTVIGDGAIIGMGTVVAGTVPPMAIIAGAKWRIIGTRDSEHYRQLDAAERYGGSNGVLYHAPESQADYPVRLQ